MLGVQTQTITALMKVSMVALSVLPFSAAFANSIESSMNQTAFSLMREEAKKENSSENILISGPSIHLPLGMTCLGARGETQSEMSTTLNLSHGLLQSSVPKRYKTWSENLSNSNLQGNYPFVVSAANWILVSEQLDLNPEFQQLTSQMGVTAQVKDFSAASTLVEINHEVSRQTRDKIPNILSELSPNDRMVLLNATYLKVKWEKSFDPEHTVLDGKFHANYTSNKSVQMMFQKNDFRYYENSQLKLIELGYQGPQFQARPKFSMYVVLPKTQADFNQLRTHITVNDFENWADRATSQKVEVYLPKFIIEKEFDFKSSLQSLGMEQAFGDRADFSGMSKKSLGLFISRVVQKTFIEVDEEGTVAASAGAVVIRLRSIASQPTEFKADRPFLFFIRDNKSKTVLFQGVVQNPEYNKNSSS